MDQAIISRATMRQRGADAFNAGRSRDSHNMNPWAPALPEWLEGFDQAAKDWHADQQLARMTRLTRPQAEVIVAEACPP